MPADFEFYYTTDEAGTVWETKTVDPFPTDIDYPDRRLHKKLVTQDGAVIIQRPQTDDRVRKWIWVEHSSGVAGYEDLWTLLKSLERKARKDANLDPTIQLKDGFEIPSLVDAQIVQATRKPHSRGGPIGYEETYISFIIVDPTYSDF